MTMKEWVTIWQNRVTNLLSRRFLGFCISSTLGFLKPETLPFMITLYGILEGGAVAKEAIKRKARG